SIEIKSFEFGSIPPTIEIQHITDPYPEFYEESYGDEDEGEDEQQPDIDPPEYASQQYEHNDHIPSPSPPPTPPQQSTRPERHPSQQRPTSFVDAWTPPFFLQGVTVGGRPGHIFPPFFHATPGIISSGLSTPTWIP